MYFVQFACLGVCCLSQNVVPLLLLLLRVSTAERKRWTTDGGQVCRPQGTRFERCAYIWAASLRPQGRPRGGEQAADSAAGDELRSFKALIASGKRSHFPNHIHAPIIYFLPLAPALLFLTHSLSHSAVPWPPLSAFASVCLCSEFTVS